jgi:transposase
MGKIIGIDISKQTFDVCFKGKEQLVHKVYGNAPTGFKKFIGLLDNDSHVVMEASGPYYVQLARYLHSYGYRVSVVNPLKIRRYAQMRFYRAKTDKKDAQTIMEYASMNTKELPVYKPESKTIQSLKQMRSALELLQKQRHQSKRQLEAFKATGYVDAHVTAALVSTIKTLEKNIRKIELQMSTLCKEHCSQSSGALTSIPSIGDKTAIMLIAITDNFKKFNHYKQLIAYVGLSPRVYQSGTSIKGKGHICKMGKSQIRKLLYMCSWTAKKCNKACSEMYQRLKAKGKPERVIKIAIANKLLKQAFAIAKSKEKYIEDYQLKVCF